MRGWSVRDAFIYAAFSINIDHARALHLLVRAVHPEGEPALGGAPRRRRTSSSRAITYASLIAAMPRAGGDYVWISRVLGGGIGFVLAVAAGGSSSGSGSRSTRTSSTSRCSGRCRRIVGWDSAVTFWAARTASSSASVITALLASLFIALGIRTLRADPEVLLLRRRDRPRCHVHPAALQLEGRASSRTSTTSRRTSTDVGNAYAETLKAGTDGLRARGLGVVRVRGDLPADPDDGVLQPLVELGRDAVRRGPRRVGLPQEHLRDGRRADRDTTVAALVLFLLFAKTFGWDFYNAANNAFWAGTIPTGVWPYPGLLAASFFGQSRAAVHPRRDALSLWFFGWVGTVFLSSTRVVFARRSTASCPSGVRRCRRNGVPVVGARC